MDTNRKQNLHTPRCAGGLSVLLTLAALVCLLLAFAATANAATIASGYCGGEGDGTNLTWTLDSEGTLTISGRGKMKDYPFLSPWEGSPANKTPITKLVIEEGTTSIGESAFEHLGYDYTNHVYTAVGTLHIPDSVTIIGKDAFQSCGGFSALELGSGVKVIEEGAFGFCRGFSNSLVFPSGLESIGKFAFNGCNSFTGSLNIPNTTSYIGVGAFNKCEGFTGDLIIPDKVTCIKFEAFAYCSGLDGTVRTGNGVTAIEEGAFKQCSNLKSVVLGDNVATIGYGAFDDCSSLTSITVASKLSVVENQAFADCKSMARIYISDLTAWCKIDFASHPFGSAFSVREHELYLNGSPITNLQIPSVITEIKPYTFYKCSNIGGTLTLHDGITRIGQSAFRDCVNLRGDLVIPDSVISIGEAAFESCSGFDGTLTLGANVETIGMNAFKNCSSFTGDLIIPNSATEIANYAFAYCRSFDGTLRLSEKMNETGYYAFGECGFTSLVLPFGVTSISEYSFCKCKNLTSLNIPDSITSIAGSAFENCSGFTGSLTIPDSVTSIGEYAFRRCGFTGNLTIPASITEIKDSTFYDCSGLTSITISGSVKAIGTYAFSNISAEIYFYGDAPSESNSFSSSSTLYYISGKAGWTSPTWHGYKTEIWDPDAAFFEDGRLVIQIFDGLSSDGTKVSCDKEMYAYPIVSETDRSFMEQMDAITGKYVLVKLDKDEQLLAIRPITSFVATASAVTSDTITFDGVQYSRNTEEIVWPEFYINRTFLVHLYDGKVIGMEQLQPLSGRLNSWDETAGSITIDDTVYPVNYLVGEDFWNEISAQQGQYVGFFLGMDWVFGYGKPYLFRASPLTGKNYIRLYASSQLMELASGESFDIFCELFRNDAQVKDWSTPAITVSDGSMLQVSSYRTINGGISFKVTGTAAGVSTLTVSDSVSGAYAAIPITVGAERSQTLSYRMDAVPDFTPGVWGDEHTQTNFYNIAGMCINNYRYERSTTSHGKCKVSFDVYNIKYMYGAVDVYDSSGRWIESKKIDKQSTVSSISQTFESAFYLIADFANGQSFSYMASTQSKKTSISIEVPDGGYFTISTNYAQSPGCMLYNLTDYVITAIEGTCSVSKTAVKNLSEDIMSKTLEKTASDVLWNSFLSQMKSNSMKMLKTSTNFSYGASMGAIVQTGTDILKSIGVDWVSLCNNVNGFSETAIMDILKMGPPGKCLEALFKGAKYLDLAAQGYQICHSADSRIITIHTPDKNSGHTTVQGVTVEAPEGAVESGAVLQVFRVNASNADEPLPEESSIESYDLYNICFVKNGEESQLHGRVTVRIPKPAGFKGSTCQVWRQEADGSWTPITAVVEGSYLVFETDHFSLYAVAVSALSAEYLGDELVVSGYIPRLPDTFGTALLAFYDDSGKLLSTANADELRSGSELAISQRFNDLPNVAFAKLFLLTQEYKPVSAAITAELL